MLVEEGAGVPAKQGPTGELRNRTGVKEQDLLTPLAGHRWAEHTGG